MTDREMLIELIGGTNYGKDNGSTIGRNFQSGFIEKIADHLIANGVTFAKDTDAHSKWISVEERFPDEREVVMCWHKAHVHPIFCKWDESNLCWDNDCWTFGIGLITHWMPLPRPPREE